MSFSSFITCLIAVIAVVDSSPIAQQANDVANDWQSQECTDLAVIFARGTFDSGNIGPWVGEPLRQALYERFGLNNVAFQGVSPEDYPADLDGYIEDGGPESCAVSLANAVQRYAAHCPSSKFVISGWSSQGALCAHKSLDIARVLTDDATRSRVLALVTFGDPISVWDDSVSFPSLPENAKYLAYCQTTTLDPLCTDVFEDFPASPGAFIAKLKAVWDNFDEAELNEAQKNAVPDLAVPLVKQASKKIGKLGRDILDGHVRRWMLTPQHFFYGVGLRPMVEQAADDVFEIYQSA